MFFRNDRENILLKRAENYKYIIETRVKQLAAKYLNSKLQNGKIKTTSYGKRVIRETFADPSGETVAEVSSTTISFFLNCFCLFIFLNFKF